MNSPIYFFVTKKFYNIINSNGINVSYSDTTYFCEYIVNFCNLCFYLIILC